jgi:hypothetical protein
VHPSRNARVSLATVTGVVLALLLSEICLRPWAGQLYRFDVEPVSADRLTAPTKTVRYYGEGIATSHFSPSRARITGRNPIASAPWIVIMGDSFVEALQLDDSETMGAVVERLAQPSDPVNVRQYGFPGASPPKYALEGADALRLWNPRMVAVIANANGFRTAALDTHWTKAQIRGGHFRIAPVTPDRLTLPVRLWFAMKRSALFEIVTSRFVLDISPEIPGLHTFHSTAEAAQGSLSDSGIPAMMVRLLKETYGDRLFLVYAAEPDLNSTQAEPEETEALAQCRMQGVRCASTGPFLRDALRSLQYFGSGFSNSAPEKGHYNARGHRLVGELIWSEYRSRMEGAAH